MSADLIHTTVNMLFCKRGDLQLIEETYINIGKLEQSTLFIMCGEFCWMLFTV